MTIEKIYGLNKYAESLIKDHISSYVWSYDGLGPTPTRPLREFDMGDGRIYREITQISVKDSNEIYAVFHALILIDSENNPKDVDIDSIWSYDDVLEKVKNLEYTKIDFDEISSENVSSVMDKPSDVIVHAYIDIKIKPGALDDSLEQVNKFIQNMHKYNSVDIDWKIGFKKSA